jgi:MscS family membrane protein
VYLRRVGDSSLEVEVSAWFETVKLEEFHAIRSEVLLQILGALEAEGVRLAYPTRTVYLAGGGTEMSAGQSQR